MELVGGGGVLYSNHVTFDDSDQLRNRITQQNVEYYKAVTSEHSIQNS
jgi:hypothetical protein